MADVTKDHRKRWNAQKKINESDDGPTEVVPVEDVQVKDPCPEGYMMDPKTQQCVIDPFQQPFADAPIPRSCSTSWTTASRVVSVYADRSITCLNCDRLGLDGSTTATGWSWRTCSYITTSSG